MPEDGRDHPALTVFSDLRRRLEEQRGLQAAAQLSRVLSGHHDPEGGRRVLSGRHLRALVVAIAAAGCANPRDDPPDVTMHTAATAEETVGCLVRELDAQFPGSPFWGGINHHAVLIVPGQVYEVTPTRDLAVGGENYFVRVTKAGDSATMEMFAPFNWVSELEPAMRECAHVAE